MSSSITAPANSQPMMEMNTTPLIDVLLVLLIMFIITIPIAPHKLEVDLPGTTAAPFAPDGVKNRIELTRDDAVLWNGKPVSLPQLGSLLRTSLLYPVEPELQFQPDAQASYNMSAKVIGIVKAAKVTRFGFVGNEQFAGFERADNSPRP